MSIQIITDYNPHANPAEVAIMAAETAYNAGTFGVGGLLLGPDGKLLCVIRNQVIQAGKVIDPTAHVERKIVDWHFAQCAAGIKLPLPSECLIVSSLCPCMMCAGAILATGFNVVAVAQDNFAGVDGNQPGNYFSLPGDLRKKAEETFGLFGIENGIRPVINPGLLQRFGLAPVISDDLARQALRVFDDSLNKTRLEINQPTDTQAADFRGLVMTSPAFRSCLKPWQRPGKFEISNQPPHLDGAALPQRLIALAGAAEQRGAAFDAAALLTLNGDVICIASGQEQLSPARTAVMELIRNYTTLRNTAEASGYLLPHPKALVMVQLHGPIISASALMALGAVGSSIEGPYAALNRESHLLHLIPCMPQTALDEMVAKLPPFYTKLVGLNPRFHHSETLRRTAQQLATGKTPYSANKGYEHA